jgi:hypothetical protein
MDSESIDSGRDNYCSVGGDPHDLDILSDFDGGIAEVDCMPDCVPVDLV